MTFLGVLLAAFAACVALRKPIYHHRKVLFAVTVAIDLAFVVGLTVGMPRALWEIFVVLVQKCTLALALFVVVMYIGVLPKDSKLHRWLDPIRGDLSIVACLLALGHMGLYLDVYAPVLMEAVGVKGNLVASFVVALVVFALLLVLGATSFVFVKKRMEKTFWKKVQRLAYPFFFLVYVHLMMILLPAAMSGAAKAQMSIAVYTAVFGVYAVLRVVRAVADRKTSAS